MNIDILKFLSTGFFYEDVNIGNKVIDVINRIGEPITITGDKKSGFMNYPNGIRIGYFDDYVDELAIVFWANKDIKYTISEYGYDITEKTLLHEFVHILNTVNITWKCNDEKNLNTFSLVTTKNVYVLFDLETGFITKISKPST